VVRGMRNKREETRVKTMAVLVVNTWAEKNDKERDDKRGVSTANRPLLFWQADDKG
jgi:hypothetical protein